MNNYKIESKFISFIHLFIYLFIGNLDLELKFIRIYILLARISQIIQRYYFSNQNTLEGKPNSNCSFLMKD